MVSPDHLTWIDDFKYNPTQSTMFSQLDHEKKNINKTTK